MMRAASSTLRTYKNPTWFHAYEFTQAFYYALSRVHTMNKYIFTRINLYGVKKKRAASPTSRPNLT